MSVADWHPEDIKAAVRKRGTSLAMIGRRAGISRQAMANALAMPSERPEQLIAAAIGVEAHQIWPSRYNPDGSRKRPQPSANYWRSARFLEQHA
ncbi:transcriptional regulator [Sphingomonas changnyeongensis]|uniref:Transcriptional regulator n=1 Tax=Sphingomonas changnyeongensis TaxID=2698679 RepID=A0A7Z2S8J2_9SPHN|nr:helix-turn-helix transcriptional regulator [Sphingomonas changnyeongensis]QHL90687.1 transcriptional regulator [Sphingomonas changnyeongensis]